MSLHYLIIKYVYFELKIDISETNVYKNPRVTNWELYREILKIDLGNCKQNIMFLNKIKVIEEALAKAISVAY